MIKVILKNKGTQKEQIHTFNNFTAATAQIYKLINIEDFRDSKNNNSIRMITMMKMLLKFSLLISIHKDIAKHF